MILVNRFWPLNNVTRSSVLVVTGALDIIVIIIVVVIINIIFITFIITKIFEREHFTVLMR